MPDSILVRGGMGSGYGDAVGVDFLFCDLGISGFVLSIRERSCERVETCIAASHEILLDAQKTTNTHRNLEVKSGVCVDVTTVLYAKVLYNLADEMH